DGVHIGTFHLIEKLARISRDRLYITALAFSVNRVKSKRRFDRTAEPRNHRKRVARDLYRNIFQIVLACAAHRDVADCHGPLPTWFGAAADPSAKHKGTG